jgi:hypothetical protein
MKNLPIESEQHANIIISLLEVARRNGDHVQAKNAIVIIDQILNLFKSEEVVVPEVEPVNNKKDA